MSTLVMLIDFDNVEPNLKSAGAVGLAKTLIPVIPSSVLDRHNSIQARLYGGWRNQGTLTTSAQRLVPDIRVGSPTVVGNPNPGQNNPLRLKVELADGPMGCVTPLQETLVRDRGLRKFRTRSLPWSNCVDPSANCGLSQYYSLSHVTSCSTMGCSCRVDDILVRDEQKMVDTLIVADIAHQALVQRASDIVVVVSQFKSKGYIGLVSHSIVALMVTD